MLKITNFSRNLKEISAIVIEANSPYNDGYVQSACKRDLVMLKYKLDKLISQCPDFGDLEKQWEQEIIIDKLTQD